MAARPGEGPALALDRPALALDRPALALIGGVDPTGGAGLLRDGWTAAARAPTLTIHAVATALTRQGQGGPAEVGPVDVDRLRRALNGLLAVPELRAVKLGMIPEPATTVIAEFLATLRSRELAPAVVLDPLLRASDGGRLGASPASLRELAAHRVDLLTPNRDEAAALCAALDLADAGELAPALGVAVLIKQARSGHAGLGERVCDRLCFPDGAEHRFDRPAVPGPDPRGTGCALATAIACELALGRSLVAAVAAAVAWLDLARRSLHRGLDGRWHLPT